MADKKKDKTAIETAYAYLASRMRTVAETERHLKEKGFGPEEIEAAVNELTELRYLDDQQYAAGYFEYNREKRRGTLRAARELAEKGVDPETIRNAREDFIFSNGIDEFEDALEAAKREVALKSKGPGDEGKADFRITDDRTAASLARKLETRGFGRDIIFRVLDRLRG